MKRRVLALLVGAVVVMTAVGSMLVSAAGDYTVDNIPEQDVVLSDANLLYAGGGDVSFENGEVGSAGFTAFGDALAAGSGTITEEAAHYGDKAIFVPEGWKPCTGSFNVELKANVYYEVSFWYNCVPGGANSILSLKDQSGVAFKDVEGKGNAETDEIWYSGSPDGVWEAANCGEWKIVKRIIQPTSDVTSLVFALNGNGVSYYDDFCVLELGETLPTPEVTPTPETTPTPSSTPTPSVSPSESTSPVVTDEPLTPVKKSIKFNKKSVKIKKGKKATLKVTIKGAKKATFSVDKKGKKVVKLSKKKAKSVVVTGKKKGKATITAKAAGKKATCKVTVK